jgi:hypothetical protein
MPALSKSDSEAYVALRNLANARILSQETKRNAHDAVDQIEKEAFREALLNIDVPESDDPSTTD